MRELRPGTCTGTACAAERPALLLCVLLQVFREIAAASGQSSQERKKGHVIKLLAASKGNEAGYIMRSLQVSCGG